jgi:hypothetical protein
VIPRLTEIRERLRALEHRRAAWDLRASLYLVALVLWSVAIGVFLMLLWAEW